MMSNMIDRFNSQLINIMNAKKANSGFLTKEKYDDLLKKVNNSKTKSSGKKPEDYQRLKRYDVMKINDVEKLIFPIYKDKSSIRFYVHFDELFNIIHETHLLIGHAGRNKMLKELQKNYKNITAEEVMIYLSLCESCQKKSKVPKKGLVRSLPHQEINSRCQVDLVDMHSQSDNNFKFLLVYQDLLTGFVQLRALKSKCVEEVASNIIDIFTIFGAPNILQSNNGREFSRKIVEEACKMWPDLKILHGKSNITQGLIERAQQELKNMLSAWLETNQSCNWFEGLRFVQLMKNSEIHEDLKCSPYEAMFGTALKVGLKTSSLPPDSIKYLETEEDLQAIISTVNNTYDNSEVEDDDPPEGKFGNKDVSETAVSIENAPKPSENTSSSIAGDSSSEAKFQKTRNASEAAIPLMQTVDNVFENKYEMDYFPCEVKYEILPEEEGTTPEEVKFDTQEGDRTTDPLIQTDTLCRKQQHSRTQSALNTPVVALQTPGLTSSYPGSLTSTFAPQDFSIGTDMGLGISWTNHQIPTSLAHASGLPHLAVSSSTPPPQSSSPVPIKIKSEPISPPREHHTHLSAAVHHGHIQTLNLAHSHHPRPNSAGQITPTPGSVTPTNLPSPSGPSSGDYESIQMHKRPRLSDWPS